MAEKFISGLWGQSFTFTPDFSDKPSSNLFFNLALMYYQ